MEKMVVMACVCFCKMKCQIIFPCLFIRDIDLSVVPYILVSPSCFFQGKFPWAVLMCSFIFI